MQRKRRVTTAVIELDALADPVGTRTENHNFLSVGGLGFVFLFISRVKVWSVGFELGAASVHALVDGNQTECLAIGADFVFSSLREISQPAIGQGCLLEGAQKVKGNVLEFRYMLLGHD